MNKNPAIDNPRFLPSARMTGWGMGVSFNMEYRYSTGKVETHLLWSREYVWREVSIDDGRLIDFAEGYLATIGYRALVWWFFESEDGPFFDACLERIPGSTAGWRD